MQTLIDVYLCRRNIIFQIIFAMIRIFTIALSAAVILSCNNAPEVAVTHKEAVAQVEKTVARIGVEGMMCEIACGGKIRKELSKLSGVASADIEYADGQPTNFAVVEYNPNLISEVEMIQCVNGIADGLYHVNGVEITHFVPGNLPEGSAGEETSELQMEFNDLRMPGVTDIFYALINFVR
ncbi:MAG: hypothetical protein RL226_508 [Bacteroidota bacterium]